jgi:hypothetical protein
MKIKYPRKSKFLSSIETQIRRKQKGILKGNSIMIDVRDAALERGYKGEVTIELGPEEQDEFVTDWEHSDPTRFPQRVRVAAWVLHRNEIYGSFRISHNSGILMIKRN